MSCFVSKSSTARSSPLSVASQYGPVMQSSTTKLRWCDMILDALLQFDNAVSLAIAAGTQVSTNVIDLGISSGIPSSANGGGARDIGIGDDPAMKLLVQVGTAFATLTSLVVALQGAVDDGTGAPSTFSTWWSSPAVVAASLVAGARLFDMDMPRPP